MPANESQRRIEIPASDGITSWVTPMTWIVRFKLALMFAVFSPLSGE